MDREKVIQALEQCIGTMDCDGCPYLDNGCRSQAEKDALALLKEQEAVARCKCGWRYCPSCGARMNGVKWDE